MDNLNIIVREIIEETFLEDKRILILFEDFLNNLGVDGREMITEIIKDMVIDTIEIIEEESSTPDELKKMINLAGIEVNDESQ